MLRARVAIAAVGLPALALLVAAPERVFGLTITILLAAAAYELLRVALNDADWRTWVTGAAATAVLAAAIRSLDELLVWPLLLTASLALFAVLRPGPELRRPGGAWWLLAVLYVGVLGGHWLLLRNEPDGRDWIVVAFAITFATDTGAYAVGRLFGTHRMAPRLSPGKTWEGATGGLVAGLATAIALPPLLDLSPEASGVALIGVTLPVAAMAGDLLESGIKRRLGVKDMSTLLPGHGGLLDRFDSLLLTGPLLYWILQWIPT